MERKYIAALIVFLLPVIGAAREAIEDPAWDRLQRLKLTQKVRIYLVQGSSIDGKFLNWEPNEFYMERKGERIRIKKENVKLLTISQFASRKMFIAGAIGFGIGCALGTAMASALDETDTGFGEHLGFGAQFGILGGVTGLSLGAMQSGLSDEIVVYAKPGEMRILVPLP